jgi:two-component system response regulator YesN
MEVVGEASDGIGALELMKSLKPDVMFLDIKMPNMDGIELLHKMQAEKIKCKVLILSGFDDVFHVKEAMRCGAVDYFHKPCMTAKDILDKLLEIKSQIVNEKKGLDNKRSDIDKIERNKNILKEVFLKELVEGKISEIGDFNSRNLEVESKLQDKNFSCIVFYVKHLEEVQKRYLDSTNNIHNSVLNVLNGVFLKEIGVEFFAYDINTYVTITSFENTISGKKAIDEINSILDIIIDAVKQFLNIEIVIGVSDLHKSYGEIKNAFDQAVKAMKYKFFKKDGDIIYYRDIVRKDDKEALLHIDIIIGKMKDSLEKHDYLSFKNNLEQFVCFLEEHPCLTEGDVKKLFNAFLFLVSEGKACLDGMEMFINCKYLRQLYNIWTNIIREKLEESKSFGILSNCSLLTKNIISFIDSNYSHEITLNLLSKHFNVSPNYISRLFKEETGEALFSYIYEVRVEKAKKLLKEIDLKIYEVSDKVGFKSPVHFNIVFNKYTGITPKQYRDGNL